MKNIFTPECSEELGPLIRKTLISAFNIMFNLDPSLSAACERAADSSIITAYVELKAGEKTAYLNVAVTTDIINELCKMLSENDEGMPLGQMGQEVACEVANIVGHAIRGYYIDNSGITISVGIPQPGSPDQSPSDVVALSLQALGKTNDAACIDFVFTQT